MIQYLARTYHLGILDRGMRLVRQNFSFNSLGACKVIIVVELTLCADRKYASLLVNFCEQTAVDEKR